MLSPSTRWESAHTWMERMAAAEEAELSRHRHLVYLGKLMQQDSTGGDDE